MTMISFTTNESTSASLHRGRIHDARADTMGK